MEEINNRIVSLLNDGNLEELLTYISKCITSEKLSLLGLYEDILIPILRKKECNINDRNICVWKEHLKIAMIRTIIENQYQTVNKYIEKSINKKAVVLCPPEEYYDIEARIHTDYLRLFGYETFFIGANTPYKDFYNAIDFIKPEIILIEVENYYNIIATHKIIEELRKKTDSKTKIYVSGSAFTNEKELYKEIHADGYIDNYNKLKEVV